MRSIPRTVKTPSATLEAIEILRQPGGPFDDYPSTNAALVGLLRYAIAFPKRHTLTAAIARLPAAEQDEIDDFLLEVTKGKNQIGNLVPKPATAEALLAAARNGKKLTTRRK